MMKNKPLLILDMDECLIHASMEQYECPNVFMYQNLFVHPRPHLQRFLKDAATKYRLAVWSTGTDAYVKHIMEKVTPKEVRFDFVWGRSKCRRRKDELFGGVYYYKPLDKLRRYGYLSEEITMIDDSPEKVISTQSRVIEIAPFEGASDDAHLLDLYAPLGLTIL